MPMGLSAQCEPKAFAAIVCHSSCRITWSLFQLTRRRCRSYFVGFRMELQKLPTTSHIADDVACQRVISVEGHPSAPRRVHGPVVRMVGQGPIHAHMGGAYPLGHGDRCCRASGPRWRWRCGSRGLCHGTSPVSTLFRSSSVLWLLKQSIRRSISLGYVSAQARAASSDGCSYVSHCFWSRDNTVGDIWLYK